MLTDTVEQVELTDVVTRLAPALEAVDGEKLARLVDTLTAAIEEDPERVGRMLSDAEVTLANVREATEDAPEAVAEARSAIGEVRAAVARTGPMLERADRVLADLEAASGKAPEIAEKLPGMVEDAEVTLAEVRALAEALGTREDTLLKVIDNLEEIDKWELRRLLREEGILVRLRESEVVEE